VVLLITGTVRLPPELMRDALPIMRVMIEASRGEDGCLDHSYAEDLLDPGLIRVTEMWRDRAALERHFRSAHIARWRATWPDLGLGERNLRMYEVGEGEAT